MSLEILLVRQLKWIVIAALIFSFYPLIGKIVVLNDQLKVARSQISYIENEIGNLRLQVEDLEHENSDC